LNDIVSSDSVTESDDNYKNSKKHQKRSLTRNTNKNVSYVEQNSNDSVKSTDSDESDFDDSNHNLNSKYERRVRKQPERLDVRILIESDHKKSYINKGKRKGSGKPARKVADFHVDDTQSDTSDDSASHSDVKKTDKKKTNESFLYRIQHILAHKKLNASQWREITDTMNTQEVTRGSVWKAPDDEYLSQSSQLIEKYLIKWTHASYLHVSWESKEDLLFYIGSIAKTAIQRYIYRVHYKIELFPDLRGSEYFTPSLLNVDRILDVVCDEKNIEDMNWETAVLPPPPLRAPYYDSSLGDVEILEQSYDAKSSANWLHGLKSCYVSVKWEGLSYFESTFENVNDLRCRGIDYEAAIRSFYKREQSQPTSKLNKTPAVRTVNRRLDPQLQSASLEKSPKLTGGHLQTVV
jgi:hypothetical protein